MEREVGKAQECARRRARLRKEVLLAGEGWAYDPERKEMRTKMEGHKCDRIAAERRAKTAKLMEQMPEMLLACKKRSCCKKNRNGMFGDIYINYTNINQTTRISC
ncbi:hypothetical protein OIU84_000001 [Salix udensis]|uniref:Uncharacterized protein n=1 Tax=Salix udensis TaxID=889485 RepID=A0AAD6L3U0_9ROSI|nr:hypothetical protein OIU84_000001 [Salix udensis]